MALGGMIQVTDLGGNPHLINPSAIIQLYFNNFLTPPGKCTVVYGGHPLNVSETVEEVVAKATNFIHFLAFNIPPGGPGTPGGFPVFVNVSAIMSVAAVTGGSVIKLAGLPAGEIVLESYPEVVAAITAARSPPPVLGPAI